MSTIEESIEDLIDTAEGFGRGIVSAKNVELAQLLINSLIAAALADARREGAEQMRDAATKLTRKEPLYYSSGEPAEEELAQAIEDLPMPAGERQAVLLNLPLPKIQYEYNKEKGYSVCAYTSDQMKEYAKSCITANNLEVRRG